MTRPAPTGVLAAIFDDDERPTAARARRLQAAIGAVTEGRGAVAEVTRLLSPVTSPRWHGWTLDEWSRELIAPGRPHQRVPVEACTTARDLAVRLAGFAQVQGLTVEDLAGFACAVVDILDPDLVEVDDLDDLGELIAACAHRARRRNGNGDRPAEQSPPSLVTTRPRPGAGQVDHGT